MRSKDRYIFPLLILILSDIAVFAGSVLLAYYFRIYSGFLPAVEVVPSIIPYTYLALITSFLGIIVMWYFDFYHNRIGVAREVKFISIFISVITTYVLLMAVLFAYRGYSFSRMVILISMFLNMFILFFAQINLKSVQKHLIAKGIGFDKTLLVGSETNCASVLEKLNKSHGSRYQVVGYVNSEGRISQSLNGVPILGSLDHLPVIIGSHPIDSVLIAMPSNDHQKILNIIKLCETRGLEYRIIPDLFELITKQIKIGEINGLPTLTLGETRLRGSGKTIKRMMDIVFSLGLLIICSPLMVILAIIIKLSSDGPIFYKQERVGMDGKVFHMYKFRSMYNDAEANGPVWSVDNDPRCTKVGRFMRKHNLDEFPQFINVLLGDMSMVGPRPERPYFVNKFKEQIPQYMRRHMVKSGITGWAQVNGLRGNTSVADRTKYDIYYIEKWSVPFDLQIILRTVSASLKSDPINNN